MLTPKSENRESCGSNGYNAPPFSSLRTASASSRLCTNQPSDVMYRPYGVSSELASFTPIRPPRIKGRDPSQSESRVPCEGRLPHASRLQEHPDRCDGGGGEDDPQHPM